MKWAGYSTSTRLFNCAETLILERSVLGSFLSLLVHFFPVIYFPIYLAEERNIPRVPYGEVAISVQK